MMNSAAVRASDSASTDGSPPSEYDGSGNRDKEKHARQLERQQIVLEERLRDHADGIQFLELLLVVTGGHDQLLRQLGANDHHDLAQQPESNEPSREPPSRTAQVSELRWMSEVEQHDHEQKHDHDRARV